MNEEEDIEGNIKKEIEENIKNIFSSFKILISEVLFHFDVKNEIITIVLHPHDSIRFVDINFEIIQKINLNLGIYYNNTSLKFDGKKFLIISHF